MLTAEKRQLFSFREIKENENDAVKSQKRNHHLNFLKLQPSEDDGSVKEVVSKTGPWGGLTVLKKKK